jgi:hypothetical protein
MPNPPDLNLLDDAAGDEQPANKIDYSLAEQEKEYIFTDKQRGEGYKKHIYRIVVTFMYAFGLGFLILFLIRAFDFAAPECWRWLSKEQDHDIERILFSGAIISLASKYFKKYHLVD